MRSNEGYRLNSNGFRLCLCAAAVIPLAGILVVAAGLAPALAGPVAIPAQPTPAERFKLPLSADGWIDLQAFL